MRILIENCDYYIYYHPMPKGIFSMCMPNPDGTFAIYLDPRRSYCQRKTDLDHELNHIRNDDFYNDLPLREIEDYL